VGTLGGHFVTEEGDLGCPKDAFGRVDEDPVPLKLVEEGPQMLLVLLEWPGENQNVVQVGEAEVEYPQNVAHEALERLGGVAEAEGHEEELE
jgi:hypothetical protein